MTRVGDLLGYARVSTSDQDLSGQIGCLTKEGAVRVFEDVIRLDRLGRSLKELLETVDALKAREINLISLE